MDSSITPVLFVVTFVLALAIGVWQYRKAKAARVRSGCERQSLRQGR